MLSDINKYRIQNSKKNNKKYTHRVKTNNDYYGRDADGENRDSASVRKMDADGAYGDGSRVGDGGKGERRHVRGKSFQEQRQDL